MEPTWWNLWFLLFSQGTLFVRSTGGGAVLHSKGHLVTTKITRKLAAVGLAAMLGVSSFTPAAFAAGSNDSSTASATTTASSTEGDVASPMDHDLMWRLWDDTIYASKSLCLSRGATLANIYTDIVSYQCRNRYTQWVIPQKYGMMLEVKRP